MTLNLHKGIEHANSRKLTLKVRDDYVLTRFLKLNRSIKFIVGSKNIFGFVTYTFLNKKDYQQFRELYELEVDMVNVDIKLKNGWFDRVIQERKSIIDNLS